MEMITKILEVLEINSLVFLQMAIVLLLTYISGKYLIRPVLRTLKERENRTTVPMEEAKEIVEKAETLAIKYSDRLREANRESLNRKRKRLDEVQRSERRVIEGSHHEAEEKINGMKEKIEREKDEALKMLTQQSREIANEIAETILGRSLS